jgi:tRNA(Ile)-lysidine synthase TilS/MesJ
MALAYLCKQWESIRPNYISVTAFVVDHKAREESTREANMVSQWLKDIIGIYTSAHIHPNISKLILTKENQGIKSEILELTWPERIKPAFAFETHARTLRFQALGKACRDRQIETLLMGHHQDDNVETTLWRLCSGAKGAGLAGIPPVTRIPECHGLYGVSESGSSYTFPNHDIKISTGGITISRPLLNHPKSALLATCHQNNVPYVSDPTNFDPTLTPRNAIRSLLASNKLPKALTPPSILSLIKSSQGLLTSSTNLSNALLSTCRIKDLNIPTGTVTIDFPTDTDSITTTLLKELQRPSKSPAQRIHQIQCLTLRRITELVSPFPENHFPARSFEDFTRRVFLSKKDQDQMSKRQSFTLGGVMFQPLPGNTKSNAKDTNPNTKRPKVNDKKTDNNNHVNNNTWLLSRQPFMRNRSPILRYSVPGPENQDRHQRPGPNNHEHGHDPQYTPWTLWDNRYWFRFAIDPEQSLRETTQESSTLSLLVRPFRQSDLQVIRWVAGSGKKVDPGLMALMEVLRREAPGQTRFTVPLLAVEGASGEVPVALPTMDLWLPGMWETLQVPSSWRLRWEWMYKMLDNEPLKLMRWL